MSARDFFLFSRERYAFSADCVTAVKSDGQGSEPTASRPKIQLDLLEDSADPRTRILCLSSAGVRTELRVRGTLSTVHVEEEQIVPLPRHFFPDSPAVAFIVLDERLVLLLSPERIGTPT